MVGEIADFVSKHKAKLFPPGESEKPPVKKRPGSVGDLGKSLEQNDPETLKFIKKHDTTIHGEKPEVATKYALDNPINSHMKPEEGVYEEMEEIEEKCSKCGSSQHEEAECGKRPKLKEETLANFIALDILEELKAMRLEGCEVHKVNPDNPDFTGGMHIGARPKAEVQTEHKPVVSSSEKSKRLKKSEVKEAHHHQEPMPKLNNPPAAGGCTGHEDPMPVISKPHADPTKIPNRNQVPNSTQPPVGVLDRKKKIKEAVIDEGLGSWFANKVKENQGRWAQPDVRAGNRPRGRKKAAGFQKPSGGFGGSIEDSVKRNQGKWTEGGKKKNK